MRFTMTKEGAARLDLDPARVCQEFDGPSIREALLGGFPRGVLGWAKKALRVDRTEQLDVVDSRLLYYVITMRMVDHTLLPIARFDELALTDFELVKHEVTSFDQDGDCGECSMTLDNRVHITSDDPPEVPPTQAPDGPATSATVTP